MNASSPRTPADIPSHIDPSDVVDYGIYGDSRFRATGFAVRRELQNDRLHGKRRFGFARTLAIP